MKNYSITQGFSGCKLSIKMSEGNVCVEKISKNEEYNQRFLAQCEKQRNFMCFLNLDSNDYSTPKMYRQYSTDGLETLLMEYIEGENAKHILEYELDEQKCIAKKIIHFLEIENHTYLPFDDKANFNKMLKNKVISLSHWFNSETQNQINISLDKVEDLMLPQTYCHGDFTLENMIIDKDKKIYFVDFLDNFYSHVWFDIAKLYQDLEADWQRIKMGIKDISVYKKSAFKKQIDNSIREKFPDYSKYHYFMLALTLMRIVPYSTEQKISDILKQKIAVYLEKFNSGIMLGDEN